MHKYHDACRSKSRMHMAMPIGKLFQDISYCGKLQNFKLFNFNWNLSFPKVSLQKNGWSKVVGR